MKDLLKIKFDCAVVLDNSDMVVINDLDSDSLKLYAVWVEDPSTNTYCLASIREDELKDIDSINTYIEQINEKFDEHYFYWRGYVAKNKKGTIRIWIPNCSFYYEDNVSKEFGTIEEA